MFLFSRDWLQLGITLSILVVSYLMLDAWGVVILFIAKIREVFTDILLHALLYEQRSRQAHTMLEGIQPGQRCI